VGGSAHPRTKGYYPKEEVSFFLITTHVFNAVISAVKMLILLNCFSFLQVKNKSHDGVTKYAFILEPISMVANNKCTVETCLHPWLMVKPVRCTLATL
jgi:hypothetical protein